MKIKLDALKHDFARLTEGSQEAGQSLRFADAGQADVGGDPVDGLAGAPDGKGGLTKTPALDQFTTNLVQRARDAQIDPVIAATARSAR